MDFLLLFHKPAVGTIIRCEQQVDKPVLSGNLHVGPDGSPIPDGLPDEGNPVFPLDQRFGVELDFRREGIETEVPGVGCQNTQRFFLRGSLGVCNRQISGLSVADRFSRSLIQRFQSPADSSGGGKQSVGEGDFTAVGKGQQLPYISIANEVGGLRFRAAEIAL